MCKNSADRLSGPNKPNRVITSTLKKAIAAILGNDASSPTLRSKKRLPRHRIREQESQAAFSAPSILGILTIGPRFSHPAASGYSSDGA